MVDSEEIAPGCWRQCLSHVHQSFVRSVDPTRPGLNLARLSSLMYFLTAITSSCGQRIPFCISFRYSRNCSCPPSMAKRSRSPAILSCSLVRPVRPAGFEPLFCTLGHQTHSQKSFVSLCHVGTVVGLFVGLVLLQDAFDQLFQLWLHSPKHLCCLKSHYQEFLAFQSPQQLIETNLHRIHLHTSLF